MYVRCNMYSKSTTYVCLASCKSKWKYVNICNCLTKYTIVTVKCLHFIIVLLAFYVIYFGETVVVNWNCLLFMIHTLSKMKPTPQVCL